ncbi:MAG: cytochrome P460 family protein [Deltaproteobacteria bacterium]|nr:cytochrome P460 family protein [Deltaproteobacteria bacterium]
MTFVAAGCGADLPEDIRNYETLCTPMATAGPYDDDPHSGNKRIFACNVDKAFLAAGTRPFPDGTIIVKESTKPRQCAPWLIATMRKQAGKWSWAEYTRNFADEDFGELLVPSSTCTGCHDDAKDADWVFSQFSLAAASAKICAGQP